jgi:hypothetical protein
MLVPLVAAACMADSPQTEGVEQAVITPAAADPNNGPFASEPALLAYWQSQPPAFVAVFIYYDGRLIFRGSGTGGPVFGKEYFQCTGDVRPQCTNKEAGSTTARWLETTFGTGKNIFVDGTRVQTGAGGTLDTMGCRTDAGYFVVHHLDGSGPAYDGSCTLP